MDRNVQPDVLKGVFRANLKNRRKELGLTQAALAKKIEAHQPYIADLESGDRSPALETLAKLSEALGTSPAELLGENFSRAT